MESCANGFFGGEADDQSAMVHGALGRGKGETEFVDV